MSHPPLIPFREKLGAPLIKDRISILQINLGKKCNLACNHCHVEAGPKRTEELTPEATGDIIELIRRFPAIKTVDLTGGAPEMNQGFKPIVETAVALGKEVIVRSNLTIFFVPGYEDLPRYFQHHKLRVVASLPCYLEDNVDKQRGRGVYKDSILALQILNKLGYGREPGAIIDLVYNPPVPRDNNFKLTPDQKVLERDYRNYLKDNFNIDFNNLFTITNLPIGRTKEYLKNHALYHDYLVFLQNNHNSSTVNQLMCKQELSIDYLGNVYDCDFNQMEKLPSLDREGNVLTVRKILAMNNLDVIGEIQTAPYCYGCTAGSGSSCGGALV